jgi:signal transduction histidine kinase
MAAALASAIEEVDRLTRLASDLLVIASAEQGQLPVRRVELDVARSVRTIAERFDRIAQTQGRSVSAAPGETLIAQVDPDRLEQAVDNLVANALRHGAGAVELETRERAGQIEIHVFDDGCGFPADFLPHAFQPFTRADPARSSGEASGLGLSIVLAIAEAHGGSAGAENRPSGGAHVWVTLPRLPADGADVGAGVAKYATA